MGRGKDRKETKGTSNLYVIFIYLILKMLQANVTEC